MLHATRTGALAASVTLLGLLATPALIAAPERMEDVPLISRELFFGNPERSGVQLSPNGDYISFRAPIDGVQNVWIAPADDPDAARPVTSDADRGIRQYFWAENGSHLIYLQDRGGDENWRAYAVHVSTREEIDLTPMEGVQARIASVDRDHPNHILIGVNDRSPQLHDVYRVDVRTGERELVFENPGYVQTLTDNDMNVRLGVKMNSDGSMTYEHATGDDAGEVVLDVPQKDTMTTGITGFIGDTSKVYFTDSRDRDTGALYIMDLETGARELVFADPRVDIGGGMTHPVTDELEAVVINYTKPEPVFFNKDVERDYNILKEVRPEAEVNLADRSEDDRTWLVAYTQDDGPVEYYLYDRDARTPTYLFTNRPELEGKPLAPMHPVVIKSRDGLDLVSYLTIPVWTDADGDARPNRPVPMVLFVHGGPWARDNWGFNPYHQWLANRGYAVLSVNFRGSTGFGKDFIAAGNGQWADAMHNDLIDAVNWAVEEGVAQKDKVAIMGGSYGGYATLAGLTFTPEVFACGVDIVGPSNLITLMQSIPPYWEPIMEMFSTRVADVRTPEGRRQLRDMSPLTHVDEIVKPLLIGQGANDPRVKIAESDQIADAMQERGIPVTYVVFPDEGHGFAKPENNKAFNAITEAFLAKHLGGRAEPLGDAVSVSSAEIRSLGELDLPGVEVAEAAPADTEPAPAPERGSAPAFDDLTPEQQQQITMMLQQIDQAPAEMLPMILQQVKSGRASVPEADLPAFEYLLDALEKRIEDNGG